MKPTTAVIGPGETIRMPDCGGADPLIDAEGELAVVIGAEARDVAEDDALGVVLGYTAAADVTARRWQTTSGPPLWIRGKGFDTFCPLGPVVVTTAELGNASGLGLRTIVNGTVVRQASTDDMLRPVAALVSELSRHVTLRPGTVILTGAPSLLKPEEHRPLGSGDEVVVEIEGIGRLVNRVEADVGES